MRTHRQGHSLVELIFAMLVCAASWGLAAPLARRTLDTLAVVSARDELAAALALTRASAIVHGGASLHIDANAGTLRIAGRAGEQVGDIIALRARHRVVIDIGGAAAAELRYDALGIGRLANRTVRLRRGGVEAGIAVSAYGRWRPL